MSFVVTLKFSGVGKSCILSRVMDNVFKESTMSQFELNLVLSSSKLVEK